jgi:hypothetical protein
MEIVRRFAYFCRPFAGVHWLPAPASTSGWGCGMTGFFNIPAAFPTIEVSIAR